MEAGGARVLLVDGDPVALGALDEIFRAAGMVTRAVQDAQTALAEAGQSYPDLCIADMALPDMNGIQLVEQLRRRPELRRCAIIGITGHRDQSLLLSSFSVGADDFMFKPIAGEELLMRSRLAIGRRRSGNMVESFVGARRDLTALFCDVRGFTAIAGRHDPEWVVEVLNGIFEKLVLQVTTWGGQVDKFLGDGLLALFGMGERRSPHELSAVQAALSMVQAVNEYSRESLLLEGTPVAVGVGVASGEVVVAPVGARVLRQVTAIGDAVNLASRLQGVAGEGEVLVCDRTFLKANGALVAGPAREVVLKGVAGARRIHPVLGLRPDGWLG